VEECGTAGQATDENVIGHMRFACWIIKATHIHLEYAINTAFLRQHWLRERASTLRYTHIASPVVLVLTSTPLNKR
jgi:hypothetical protein